MSKFIIKSFRIISVIKTLQKWYPKEFEGFGLNDYELINLRSEFNHLISCIDIKKNRYEIDVVDNYLKSIEENDKIINEGIKPVDILDNWSAGYLAPNGDFYGLNGEIANMIHLQIADALEETGILSKGDSSSIDSKLEELGWVKIHDDWVLYGGYDMHRIGNEDVPLTDIQVKKIYEYGQLCHKGILQVGYQKERISAAKFQMTEKPMLRKLFQI